VYGRETLVPGAASATSERYVSAPSEAGWFRRTLLAGCQVVHLALASLGCIAPSNGTAT
jgi:hypothetical protein